MNSQIHCADVLDWCAEYEGEPFHAVLCDPPYSLGDGKRGFMNKAWDNCIAFQPTTWAAIAEHLHPGGFILAFGGSRTYHRLAVAAEDAGLIVHPALVWLNGQGFPKATQISKQLDDQWAKENYGGWCECEETKKRLDPHQQSLGAGERSYIPPVATDQDNYNKNWKGVNFEICESCGKPTKSVTKQYDTRSLYDGANRGYQKRHSETCYAQDTYSQEWTTKTTITAPATPLAAAWASHRYGLQALKPCAEFILCAQKPYAGKPVDCITSTGAGALWIEGSRVSYQGESDWNGAHGGNSGSENRMPGWGMRARPQSENIKSNGRWPPNVVLSHLPGCERRGVKRVRGTGRSSDKPGSGGYGGDFGGDRASNKYADPDGTESVADWACVDGCPCRELGEQSGERRSAYINEETANRNHRNEAQATWGTYGSESGLSYSDKGTAARFYPQFSWQYEIAERLAGVVPFRYQAKAGRRERSEGLNDFYWRKDKDSPIGFVRISHEEWESLPEKERAQGNIHPTQKPIELCKFLATLLLPPIEYAPRRILIPFFGKGSEGAGAGLAGWEEIVGIEKEPDYCEAGRARLDHWLKHMQMELFLL